jgi:hypothetical protein
MKDSRKFILQKTALIAIGQALCVAVMIGIFALLGHYDNSVLLGGILGAVVAIGNFFVMAVCADLAADRAEQGNVKAGQALIRFSYFGRIVVIALLLFALVKSGLCHVIAAVVPLIFNRPILTLSEFFGKGKGSK